MSSVYPPESEWNGWDEMDERWKAGYREDAAKSEPYVARLLELSKQLEAVKQEMAAAGVWQVFAPTHEFAQELENIGVYDTWVPSAQDC